MNKAQLNQIFDELYPINRSIIGDGYRKSLKIIMRYVPFKKIKFKSGQKFSTGRYLWNGK